jgi:hypothetical protein
MDDWLVIGIFAGLLTAGVIAWGLHAQRQKPERRWPIVAVGLLAGLVAGLAILQAIWAESRWPHRRRLIDAVTIVVSCGLVLAVAYEAYGPPFGLGPTVHAGRIERPVAGYALTLPDSWRIEDVSGVREFFGEETPSGTTYDLLAVEGEGDTVAVVTIIEDEMEVSPAIMAAGLHFSLIADPDYDDVERVAVSLPAGDAFRVDATNADGQHVTMYPLSVDGRKYCVLMFIAGHRPDDRWLSIAETFEFLSPGTRTQDAGSTMAHQPERASAGSAISLPDDWEFEEAAVSGVDRWDREQGTPAQQHGRFLASGGVLRSYMTSDTQAGHQQCYFYDFTSEAAQDLVNGADDEPGVRAVERVPLDLPGGRAVALDLRYESGWDWRDYLVTDGDRWLLLGCGSLNPPEDRWLSIARTIEFLPEST